MGAQVVEQFKYWPEPVEVIDSRPSVNLSALPRDQKRKVWNHLTEHHPEMAKLLFDIGSDDALQSLIAETNATLEIDAKFIPGNLTSDANMNS